MTNRAQIFTLLFCCLLLVAVPAFAGKGGKGKGPGKDDSTSPAPENGLSELDGRHYIIRTPTGKLAEMAKQFGLDVVERVPDPDGEAGLVAPSRSISNEHLERDFEEERQILGYELVKAAGLPETVGTMQLDQSFMAILESARTPGELTADSAPGWGLDPEYAAEYRAHFSTPLWNGYVLQPAVRQINLHQALAKNAKGKFGAGIVAVIDTGVDPDHPVLAGALIPGYDFLRNESGDASEWNGLDQSFMAILEQSFMAILEQSFMAILEGDGEAQFIHPSTAPILDQSFMAILEGNELPPAFGHGTMVAGIVRMVAPGAKIMPLRVFDAHGKASVFDVVRAIYYAVDRGANVINMSFSMDEFSPELMRAVNYAHRKGVVCVAAAGNQAADELTYPASLGNTIGTASVNVEDHLSLFTNYGSDMVSLAAPGDGVITTYPGGLYAAAWGTSFAAPFVSGTAALLHKVAGQRLQEEADFYQTVGALDGGAARISDSAKVGAGRLDIYGTVRSRMQVKH